MTLVLPPPEVELETLEALSRPGSAAIGFVDEVGNPDRPLTLWTYRAAEYTPDRPVVLVQHGIARNGWDYRDFWIEPAERHGLMIVATAFSEEHWPEPPSYNNGLVFDEAGAMRPRASWGYAVPARVFAALREAGVTHRERAFLFGHSAGGQFVHRLLSTQGGNLFEAATAANAGWYSLPDPERPFPEGLGGIGLDGEDVARLLAYPLTILAGDRDTDTSDPQLPAAPEALAQGPHRFARARNYLAFGRAEADRLGLPCNWRLVEVPGIGHDGDAMSKVAASLWFDGRLPDLSKLAASDKIVH